MSKTKSQIVMTPQGFYETKAFAVYVIEMVKAQKKGGGKGTDRHEVFEAKLSVAGEAWCKWSESQRRSGNLEELGSNFETC